MDYKYDSFKIISGSADRTMRLWELSQHKNAFECKRTLMTGSKCLDLNVVGPNIIISGFYDKSIRLHDIRTGRESHKSKLDGKPALIQIDSLNSNLAYISVDSNHIYKIDLRNLSPGGQDLNSNKYIMSTFEHENLLIQAENNMKICYNAVSGILAAGSISKQTFLFRTDLEGESSVVKIFDMPEVPLSYCWDDEGRLFCGMRGKKFSCFE